MAKDPSPNLFTRLSTLFRSGPVIKRTVRDFKAKTGPGQTLSAYEMFRKNHSSVYSSAMSAYGTYDRLARYSDFSEMDYYPEINSALDIYSEEVASPGVDGQILSVYSENKDIERLLNELFFDTLNVNFNLTAWVRNLCKYGDFCLFNDVHPGNGVLNVIPIPVNEIEREENFDPKDPMAVRYRWVTQGNTPLENWQVTHFRLLGNDAFLPYGSSVLEGARRVWRQLVLAEDAMLVYRVVRSPDRRVFYIDVGNVPPEEIPMYMEQAQAALKKSQVVDKNTGRVDMRYNPMSVDEDYFIPVRGGESGTKIDTLSGGTNAAAIEDVQYIQKKLFAALKIPKAYLGYDESIGSKATLSQEDIRFSRTIARIQRTVIAELNKLAIIHLYSNGFDGDDLLDFTLQLPNPSTIAQQQKLDLYGTRFDIVSKAPEGYFDKRWLRKNLLGLTDEEIEEIEEGRVSDKLRELELEKVQAESEGGGMTQEPTDTTGGEIGSMPPPPPQPGGPPEGGGDIPMGGSPPEAPVGAGAGAGAGAGGEGPPAGGPAAPLDEIQFDYMKIGDEDSPLRAQRMIDRSVRKLEGLPVVLSEARRARSKKPGESKEEYDFWQQYNARRRKPGGNLRSSVDHNELTKHDKGDERDAITHPYGEKKDYSPSLKDLTPTIDESVQRDIDEVVNSYTTSMTNDINSALRSLRAGLPKTREDKE